MAIGRAGTSGLCDQEFLDRIRARQWEVDGGSSGESGACRSDE